MPGGLDNRHESHQYQPGAWLLCKPCRFSGQALRSTPIRSHGLRLLTPGLLKDPEGLLLVFYARAGKRIVNQDLAACWFPLGSARIDRPSGVGAASGHLDSTTGQAGHGAPGDPGTFDWRSTELEKRREDGKKNSF